jgi:hypothetical protein
MAWFKRTAKELQPQKIKDVQGLWYKSPTGKIIDQDELARNLWVSQRRFSELEVKNILKYCSTTTSLRT